MRPIRLTLQAFGPYAGREVIDFQSAIEAGLFGIYGQTGSGKSTIFSGMTFALFGEAMKSEQDSVSLRSDHADPNLTTEVEFVFDIGERRFVVFRRPEQMRPKHHGGGETRSTHEAFLFDATGLATDDITDKHRGKIIAEKKVRAVDAAIKGMLGYGSDQFRQIVVLPQGRFEKFLSAKTKERLEILRELFDVSLFQAIMDSLKSEAAEAERYIQEERKICVRRLEAEGFESTDALIADIEESEILLKDFLKAEKQAKKTEKKAQTELQQAENLEEKFIAAEQAKKLLSELTKEKSRIETLSKRVQRAELARTLLDPEVKVDETRGEVKNSEIKLGEAQKASAEASELAEDAAIALQEEIERSDETNALRNKRDELKRFGKILEKAEKSAELIETARQDENEATETLEETESKLEELCEDRQEKVKKLNAERKNNTLRAKIDLNITRLSSLYDKSVTFEETGRNVATAQKDVDRQTPLTKKAIKHANAALKRFESAEQDLSNVQAVHLAQKLETGSPCPVCGATEHPALASGKTESAGLDRAFREAKSAREEADKTAKEASEKLAGMNATLKERQKRLAKLTRPKEPSKSLATKIEHERAKRDKLGKAFNIEAAERKNEQLGKEIATLEKTREKQRKDLEKCREKVATATAKHEQTLSDVPKKMRNQDALDTALETTIETLEQLEEAKAEAEETEKKTRENALAAKKDVEAADKFLKDCRKRLNRVMKDFKTRLVKTSLSEKDYQALKPAIETIEQDRETVEGFRRNMKSATDAANKANAEIKTLSRPNLQSIMDNHEKAKANLTTATEERTNAKSRVDRLTQLRDSLAETMRRLDEAEAASGHLRELAALTNGHNPHKLTLETYAIGAMFDHVLESANLRLGPMSLSRYQLERDLEGSGRGNRGLGIRVSDVHTGKSRPTNTLSGGETFIAALALALGLADVVEGASGKVRLDTIFIDEGFGSLDTENGSGTLDQVLQVLNNLVSQSRAVGLISHVPLVQEAIPNGFYVRKGLSGSSVEEKT